MARRIRDHLGHVGLRVGGQRLLHAGPRVEAAQLGRVGADAAQQIELAVVAGEAGHAGGEHVLGAPLRQLDELAGRAGPVHQHGAAVGRQHLGPANAQAMVGDPADGADVVLGHQRPLAGPEVDLVHVVQLRVAVVEADQDLVGVRALDRDDLRLHLLERGQVARLAAGGRHRVHVPVLVAALVLDVDDVLAVLGPEVLADAAQLVGGDDRVILLADGLDEDVEHALVRRQVGQPLAVGRQPGRGLDRVAEQHLARDERHRVVGGALARCSSGRGWRAGGRGARARGLAAPSAAGGDDRAEKREPDQPGLCPTCTNRFPHRSSPPRRSGRFPGRENLVRGGRRPILPALDAPVRHRGRPCSPFPPHTLPVGGPSVA